MKIAILIYDADTDPEIGAEPDDAEYVSSFVQAEEALGRLENHYLKRKVEANNIIPENES
jgi:hypothetical protein